MLMHSINCPCTFVSSSTRTHIPLIHTLAFQAFASGRGLDPLVIVIVPPHSPLFDCCVLRAFTYARLAYVYASTSVSTIWFEQGVRIQARSFIQSAFTFPPPVIWLLCVAFCLGLAVALARGDYSGCNCFERLFHVSSVLALTCDARALPCTARE